MQRMERFTIKAKTGETAVGSKYGLMCKNGDLRNVDIFAVIDKLGEYEDTGLEPEEIEKMKERVTVDIPKTIYANRYFFIGFAIGFIVTEVLANFIF